VTFEYSVRLALPRLPLLVDILLRIARLFLHARLVACGKMINNSQSKTCCGNERNLRFSPKTFKSRRKSAAVVSKNSHKFCWSGLPIEILSNVLEFVPVRIACKTAVVNRSWNSATILNARTTKYLTITKEDCPFTRHAISTLLVRYNQLDALHFSTEEELPLEAVESIVSSPHNTRLRSLSGFVVSNCVVGHQPVMGAIAQISSLEELSLDGSLLTGESLRQLADSCTGASLTPQPHRLRFSAIVGFISARALPPSCLMRNCRAKGRTRVVRYFGSHGGGDFDHDTCLALNKLAGHRQACARYRARRSLPHSRCACVRVCMRACTCWMLLSISTRARTHARSLARSRVRAHTHARASSSTHVYTHIASPAHRPPAR
jgi:hypothetical protein